MKKAIITACFILSGLIILDSFNTAHVLMMFFLAGIIPGTNISMSAQHMMEVFALLTGFVVARLMSRAFRLVSQRLLIRRTA